MLTDIHQNLVINFIGINWVNVRTPSNQVTLMRKHPLWHTLLIRMNFIRHGTFCYIYIQIWLIVLIASLFKLDVRMYVLNAILFLYFHDLCFSTVYRTGLRWKTARYLIPENHKFDNACRIYRALSIRSSHSGQKHKMFSVFWHFWKSDLIFNLTITLTGRLLVWDQWNM